jgi:hypothetical protein
MKVDVAVLDVEHLLQVGQVQEWCRDPQTGSSAFDGRE